MRKAIGTGAALRQAGCNRETHMKSLAILAAGAALLAVPAAAQDAKDADAAAALLQHASAKDLAALMECSELHGRLPTLLPAAFSAPRPARG